jgi:hypothetical protein
MSTPGAVLLSDTVGRPAQPTSAVHALRSRFDEGFALTSERSRVRVRPDTSYEKALTVTTISPVHLILEAAGTLDLGVGTRIGFTLCHPPEVPKIRGMVGHIVKTRAHRAISAVEIDFSERSFETRREVSGLIARLLDSGEIRSEIKPDLELEVITDSAHIMEIFRALIANGATGYIHSQQANTRPHVVSAGRIERGSELPIHWWVERPWPEAPFQVLVQSYNSLYSFHVDEYRDVDGLLAFETPRRIIRSRSRSNRRISINDMTVTFRHPDCGDLRVTRKVVNVSHYGLAFFTDPSEDMIYPGLELPALVVSAGDKCTLLQGRVRHVSPGTRTGTPICGIEIIPKSPFHPRIGWAHILEPHLHPTSTRASADEIPALWELLDASGYFQLSGKALPDFDPMWKQFERVSQKYAQHPAVGCQVLWRSPWGVDATISISLMYSGTWLLYQLARRKGRSPVGVRGRQIVRDVYIHAFEHAAWYPTLQWVLAYTEANVRWHKVTHQLFAERYSHTGKVMNIPFRLMEDTARRAPPSVGRDFDIGDATTEELEMFIARVRDLFPAGFADAIDLVPSRFYLEDVNRTLARADLSRERRLFVARRDGVPIAAALCETGTPGMHLFRLFEGVRLISLAEDSEPAMLRLIDYARNWYAEQGHDAFVYYMQPEQFELGRKVGLKDLGDGYTWLIHTSLIDDFLEHIDRLSAPRDVPSIDEQIPGRQVN